MTDTSMGDYQAWEHAQLEDIGHDTDALIKMLGGQEMSESFDSGALLGMLANKGVDPGIIAMLNDRRDRGDWGDGSLLILLFLIIMMGGNGWGGFNNRDLGVVNGVDRTVVNEANYSRLLDAVGTQGTRQEVAIQGLAQSLNCSAGQIQMALAGVDKQLAVNQGSIINAVQSVGCQLGNQLSQCCCQTQRAIENQGCQTRAEIAETRYNMASQFAAQTALLQSQHCDTINTVNRRFAELELRDMQRDLDQKNELIQTLRTQLSQEQQTTTLLAAINARSTTTTAS